MEYPRHYIWMTKKNVYIAKGVWFLSECMCISSTRLDNLGMSNLFTQHYHNIWKGCALELHNQVTKHNHEKKSHNLWAHSFALGGLYSYLHWSEVAQGHWLDVPTGRMAFSFGIQSFAWCSMHGWWLMSASHQEKHPTHVYSRAPSTHTREHLRSVCCQLLVLG